jgi:hypothetical protein
MSIGWIKLHRSLSDHWINEKRKFSKYEAWLDILMNVNYEDNKVLIKGKLYEVKRGQSILSLDSWAKRWIWDKSAVRRFFNLLQKDSMIEIVSDNITTHLTICNYDSYQGQENADETQKKRKRNSKEIQMTPIKESKEEEENKEEKKIPPFEEFFEYCKSKYIEEGKNPENFKTGWKRKYDSWVVNGWKDGFDNEIKNWKSKALNSMEHIKAEEPEKPKYYEMPL